MSSLASDAALPPTAVVRRALECARCRDDDTVLDGADNNSVNPLEATQRF